MSFIPKGTVASTAAGTFSDGEDSPESVSAQPHGATFNAAWTEKDEYGRVTVKVSLGL